MRVAERFVVTGAYGCIGAWVVKQLAGESVDVVAVDASTDDHRVRALLNADELGQILFVTADISDRTDVERLFERSPTHIVHLAALQVPACQADPVRGAQVNVVGTIALFAAAAARGLKTPLVYASSAAAFASVDGEARPPSEPGGHPATHYGTFKYANENSARIFAADSGINSVGLRPYVVYGPGRDQGLTSAPTKAMLAASRGERFVVPYTGRSQMQYAPDVAAAFVAAARLSFEGATVLNLPGAAVSVAQIVAEIEAVVPQASRLIRVEGPPLPFPAELDSTHFQHLLGEVPLTCLSDGISQTIRFFREG